MLIAEFNVIFGVVAIIAAIPTGGSSLYLLAAADAALGAAMIVVNVKKLNDLKNGNAYTNPTFLGMDQQLLDNLGVALMLVNLAILAKHGLNKAADKLVNSKNMSALDETWTTWKQQTKDRLNKSVDDITEYVSDSMERMRNTRFGPELATEGPAGVYFTKPKKPIPPNSQQQRFWSEMEAGKDDLAKKLDEGTGYSAQIPRTGAKWNDYYKSKYGDGNFTWVTELKSYDDILSNPKALWSKSADEVGRTLGDGWTKGTYGSAGTGWKFTNGDKSVLYPLGGGGHEGSYIGFSSGRQAKSR
ncbi:hypothetical protein PAECIP111890_06266 [Paenibacillus sp. JJ-223]|nr:hypothetical protein PAECIP111890_06266 [Paenibacillus sp. JJ-223]